MNMLTVEDINSVILNYQYVPFWYKVNINTGENTVDFTDVKFDYCKVSREYDNGNYNFTITVDNILWTGAFYIVDGNEEYLSERDIQIDEDYLYVTSETSNILLYVFLSNFKERDDYLYPGLVDFKVTKVSPFKIFNTSDNQQIQIDVTKWGYDNYLNVNGQDYRINNNKVIINADWSNTNGLTITGRGGIQIGLKGYYSYPLWKINPIPVVVLNEDLSLVNGEFNNIPFNENTESLDFTVDCKYPVTIDYGNNIVKVDLTEKDDLKNVKLKVQINDLITEYNYTTQYSTINTIDQFNQAISQKKSVIYLGDDLTLNSNVEINHQCIIHGDEHSITLGDYHFIVGENTVVKLYDLTFKDSDYAILQNQDSKLIIDNCIFNNLRSHSWGNSEIGCAVKCNVDLHSLGNSSDFITEIYNTTFKKIDLCILHGGNLTVDNCSLIVDENWVLLNGTYNYGTFLYQTDGDALITNSNFDVHIPESYVVPKGGIPDFNFLPALIMCGETATINGADYTELQNNNTLPFFDIPFNNISHIDLRYKHSVINDYITLSDEIQNKACCHAVSGVDFLFKNNVKIERS